MKTKALPELEFSEWEESYDITLSDAKDILLEYIYDDLLYIIGENHEIVFDDQLELITFLDGEYKNYSITVTEIDGYRSFKSVYSVKDDVVHNSILTWV